jgi:ATP-dependent Clp protease ATP-binding subunit ClpC
MTTVPVAEPDHDQAIQILESKVGFFEGKYNVYIDYNAVEQAVDLSARYINDRYLPDKAISIMQLTAVKVSKKTAGQDFCSKEDIAEVISEQTGIPVSKVSASETEKLLSLEDSIHKRMIGQEEAVVAISGSLRRARAELRESKRPIASFLFLGPTGVGKTELAKTVAEVYFGDENCMIRLDMSEYQLPDSVKKMIGDADGTLGYLTEAVRKKPFTLVLLDEVEKAHPDILNLFLQMMDDGRLTDGQGRTINFTNSIIVATSNAGALYIEDAVQNNVDMNIIKQELVDNQLNKIMRPELINRFDGIIVFRPLSFENVVAITKLMLKKIAKNLEAKGIELLASEAGTRILAQQGYDPKFGARPLRRLLQDKVENEIANLVLANAIKRRDAVVIDDNGNIGVEKGREL